MRPAVLENRPSPAVPYPWDGFLVGAENELAHAGVLALARGDREGISPLLLHGPSGVGKSRLLTGLVGERLIRRPGSALAHLTAEAFAARCAEAMTSPGGWTALREMFRELDLFVLEDLHVLERAPLALEELSHTLDALDEAGAAVAVSARSAPASWVGWPRRLVSRLSGGLSIRIEPPGLASRRRYLLERIRLKGINLTAGALETLAEAADGYRTLDGWLTHLSLSAKLHGRPLDGRLIDPLVAEDLTRQIPSIDTVARAVAAQFGVPVRDLRSTTRRQTAAIPRHLAMYLARAWTGASVQAVGAYFGGRDPATVRHACKQAAQRLSSDPALAAASAALTRPWRSASSVEELRQAPPL